MRATQLELIAISGHKPLSQVELYTTEADRKRLANAGMAKRLRGAHNENPDFTNLDAPGYKPSANYLKLLKLKNAMRFHQGSTRGQSLNSRYDPYM